MHELRPNQRVPEGVDAQSWLGFEHRVGQRRFAALVTAADKALADGDLTTVQAALDEARELCPDAPELLRLESAIAMTATPNTGLWPRAAGAVALLVVGVSMVMGLEVMQRATDERCALRKPRLKPPSPTFSPPPRRGPQSNLTSPTWRLCRRARMIRRRPSSALPWR
jgi:hypothetical protein